MIMISNQPFSNWAEVFDDQIIASAILDRVLLYAISVNIKGESSRLKEKLKAGLLAKHAEQPKPHGVNFDYRKGVIFDHR